MKTAQYKLALDTREDEYILLLLIEADACWENMVKFRTTRLFNRPLHEEIMMNKGSDNDVLDSWIELIPKMCPVLALSMNSEPETHILVLRASH